jgi:hypothetical protein
MLYQHGPLTSSKNQKLTLTPLPVMPLATPAVPLAAPSGVHAFLQLQAPDHQVLGRTQAPREVDPDLAV